jgi:sugar lactone lactonase YvrE
MGERRVLVTGRGLVEAPRWHDGRLYFSDGTAGEVVAVDSAGHGEVVARVKSFPLCSALLPDGRLLIVRCREELGAAAELTDMAATPTASSRMTVMASRDFLRMRCRPSLVG